MKCRKTPPHLIRFGLRGQDQGIKIIKTRAGILKNSDDQAASHACDDSSCTRSLIFFRLIFQAARRAGPVCSIR